MPKTDQFWQYAKDDLARTWTQAAPQERRSSPQLRPQQKRREMPRTISEEESPTEDEIARKKLGPRGVPGGPDTAKMTPQQEKNIPKTGDFDGHTA